MQHLSEASEGVVFAVCLYLVLPNCNLYDVIKINVLFNGILATMLMRILNNVPGAAAVADLEPLHCLHNGNFF